MVQRNTIVGKKVLDIIALADHPLSVIQIQNEQFGPVYISILFLFIVCNLY